MTVDVHAKRFQDLVQGRRERLGLSQEDVAAKLSLSSRAYGNWERGQLKEWTDEKLHALGEALEMSEFQLDRLFWLAVGRPPQPDLRSMAQQCSDEDPTTSDFLNDYSVLMDALSLPTFLIDHRWEVKMVNRAFRSLFCGVRKHPSAMPTMNFLRFGLFHPDAPDILVELRTWRLAMLAQMSACLERHDEDPVLQRIRREVCLRPELRDAYLNDLPTWVLDAGADLVHHGRGVHELRHPDPKVGVQDCRLVEETPRPLLGRGLTRITLVLTERRDSIGANRRGLRDHRVA
ncbi:helix-turn-helix domain-containing protein [Streptomyces sp. NPDC002553]|uniref:helix-turn-helix domain-containing protein n=1 Tax=Streptomyces sp. NPDC002553 TaxID=3154417 RepID=UPI003328AAC6